MADIRKHRVSPTSRLHLRDANDELLYQDGPNGEPDVKRPIAVLLYGPGSKEYQRAQALNSNRMIDRLKKKGKTDQTADEKTKETAEFLTACTHSWENMEYEDFKGDELSKAVYSDIELGYIAEQVNKHIGDWSNFSKASTTT